MPKTLQRVFCGATDEPLSEIQTKYRRSLFAIDGRELRHASFHSSGGIDGGAIVVSFCEVIADYPCQRLSTEVKNACSIHPSQA